MGKFASNLARVTLVFLAGAYFIGAFLAAFYTNVYNWNMTLLGALLLLNSICLLACSAVRSGKEAGRFAAIAGMLVSASFLLTFKLRYMFDLYRFPVALFQYISMFGVLCLLPAAAIRSQPRSGGVRLFLVVFFTAVALANGVYYALQIRGVPITTIHRHGKPPAAAQRMGIGFRPEKFKMDYDEIKRTRTIDLTYGRRYVTQLELYLEGAPHKMHQEIKGRVLIKGGANREFTISANTHGPRLLSAPLRMNRIRIQLLGVGPQHPIPTIVVTEKCPLFRVMFFGCMEMHCTACILPETF